MKKYFAQLRPFERRLAVSVMVVLFLVLNYAFVWHHFSDWGNLKRRKEDAQSKLKSYQATIAQSGNYQAQVKKYESQGESVAPEDQAINFMRNINAQAGASGVSIVNYAHPTTHTNQFFTEQTQNINVIATDAQLVDFLYKLGESASLVRVRGLELTPDAAHQHLNANIRLVATYQTAPQKTSPTVKPSTAKTK